MDNLSNDTALESAEALEANSSLAASNLNNSIRPARYTHLSVKLKYANREPASPGQT